MVFNPYLVLNKDGEIDEHRSGFEPRSFIVLLKKKVNTDLVLNQIYCESKLEPAIPHYNSGKPSTFLPWWKEQKEIEEEEEEIVDGSDHRILRTTWVKTKLQSVTA
uniref:Uncharacterized protein n=1 Tax=Nelumbo nucifera TaxID=4432 RepID=A0A822YQM8_NELNU|nr:TPA_asm: hypothetical protein HUJ06_005073 [Nelumbo nucifera]